MPSSRCGAGSNPFTRNSNESRRTLRRTAPRTRPHLRRRRRSDSGMEAEILAAAAQKAVLSGRLTPPRPLLLAWAAAWIAIAFLPGRDRIPPIRNPPSPASPRLHSRSFSPTVPNCSNNSTSMKTFLHRLWSKRAVRATVWTLVSLVTLYALFVSVENWTGARALAAAKERVAKEGETLDFMALVPPLPPAAENFCALEPLAGITDAKHPTAGEFDALEAITSKMPGRLPSAPSGTVPDLAPTIAHLATNGIGTPDATPAAMLAALDAAHPVLKRLADAAPRYRAAQFTPRIGENLGNGAIFAMPMPHYNLAQRLARALLLRCHLAIAAGQTGEALGCLQASLRLCEACLREAGAHQPTRRLLHPWHGDGPCPGPAACAHRHRGGARNSEPGTWPDRFPRGHAAIDAR